MSVPSRVAGSKAAAPASVSRRRAVKACIPCRKRKVRCDVTVKGTPCTNCSLDNKTCVVKERASRRLLPRDGSLGHAEKDTFEQIFDSVYPTATSEETGIRLGSCATATPSLEPPSLGDSVRGGSSPSGQNEPCEHTAQLLENEESDLIESHSAGPNAVLSNSEAPSIDNASACHKSTRVPQNCTTSMEVPYSSYPFLAVCSLSTLSTEDLGFLKAKGCLQLPAKPLLDEFVRQYFLHVHPFLPSLDEGAFWTAYQSTGRKTLVSRFPLLVFQAMLFASCSFVPQTVTETLGFSSIRSARSAFYHRAKHLYDLSTDSSSVTLCQAALLMTFWAPPESQPAKPNTMWLTIALHHARCAQSHRAWETSSTCNIALPEQQQKEQMLKRLWWCCVIRDRFLSLGLRRSIHVTRQYPVLYISDFQREISLSEVHSAETKRRLIRVLLRLMDLCNILTDVLLLVSPPDDSLGLENADESKIKVCRAALCSWHSITQAEEFSQSNGVGLRHHPVIVHLNLMYMLYYASRSVLPHQEMLLSHCRPEGASLTTLDNYGLSLEVHEAVIGMTSCIKELIQLDIARYLPLSAMAFTIMPLLLHILDINFQSSAGCNSGSVAKQRRLRVLIGAMREYQPRYDGVEWVSHAVRHVVNLAQLDTSLTSDKLITNWADLFTRKPGLYLRLTLTIDLSLSQQKIPHDQDFPVTLRGVLTPRLSIFQQPTSDLSTLIQNLSARVPPVTNASSGDMAPLQMSLEVITREYDGPTPSTSKDILNNQTPLDGLDFPDGGEVGSLSLDDVLFGSPPGTLSSEGRHNPQSPNGQLSFPLVMPDLDTQFDFRELPVLGEDLEGFVHASL